MVRLKPDKLIELHDERKGQIEQAAMKQFSQYGLLRTKISMITAEAGVSHGLFYHYFASKEELFTKLIQGAVQTSIDSIQLLTSAPGTPLEKIQMLTDTILDVNAVPAFMLLHQARNAEGMPEEVGHLMRQYPMQVYVDLLLPLFKEGQARGEFIAGDAEELVDCYFTILSGVMVLGKGYGIPRAELILRILRK